MTEAVAPEAPDLAKPYDAAAVEARWYATWEKLGVFEASDDPNDPRPAYCIPMPPPNVTGSLHMGHAQRCTLQDILSRWHRMRGFNVLWQPGIDHAGIATQTVVERQLLREGLSRHDLGREKFEARVWAWKNESGGRIAMQQRLLGGSPDWRRSKFTMDPDMSRAVTEAFVRLHEEGLIYRATRLINWCPECRTALSDLEVETDEGAQGELFEFAYKVATEDGLADPSGAEIVVATTRPETMLGDTAVAVHPDDPRYQHLHGKKLLHPFVTRLVPVITDGILVDPKFGTGAVKVTPAHDFNDFATGKRNGLEEISVLNLDGTMNENAGRFQTLDRKKARGAVKKALDEMGLARGTKAHTLNIPKCQRSGGVVEPMISTQWFCKMQSMAGDAIRVVREKKVQIIPEEWVKTWDHFLENIQDWCISRQLWWGHQIPAWHGPDGQIKVARERPPECAGPEWTQDPDVLDTWFSSALWPFSTLGWPGEPGGAGERPGQIPPALAKFYPASDLETGYDILFFWVARMVMFGTHFMKDVPFRRVLLSGLIVDETGEKMSKVKGNVIDPLDLIFGATFESIAQKTLPGAPPAEALAKFKKAYPSAAQMGSGFPAFGSDALRYTLATFSPTSKRIALQLKRIEGYRFFVNKLWNAARFVLDQTRGAAYEFGRGAPSAKHPYNAWILSRLATTCSAVHASLEAPRTDEASLELYRFFWTDVCDWTLELSKTILSAGSPDAEHAGETKAVLLHVLEASLRLLHPFLPFVTEELWHRVVGPAAEGRSIALAAYPSAEKDGRKDPALEREIELLQAVIGAARTVRSEHEIKPGDPVSLVVKTPAANEALFVRASHAISVLVRTKGTPLVTSGDPPPEKGSVTTVVASDAGSIEVRIGLHGLVTKEKELSRIDREIKRSRRDLESIEKKLASKAFAEKAPKEVVDEAHAARRSLEDTLARLEVAKGLADDLE